MTGLRILLMPNFTKPRTYELLRELCRRMAELGLAAVASSADAAAMAAADIGPVEEGERAPRPRRRGATCSFPSGGTGR